MGRESDLRMKIFELNSSDERHDLFNWLVNFSRNTSGSSDRSLSETVPVGSIVVIRDLESDPEVFVSTRPTITEEVHHDDHHDDQPENETGFNELSDQQLRLNIFSIHSLVDPTRLELVFQWVKNGKVS